MVAVPRLITHVRLLEDILASSHMYGSFFSKYQMRRHSMVQCWRSVTIDRLGGSICGRMQSHTQCDVYHVPCSSFLFLCATPVTVNPCLLALKICFLLTLLLLRRNEYIDRSHLGSKIASAMADAMKVTLKFVDGKAMTIDVDKNEDVDKVKEAVHEKHGFEVEKQRLIYGGGISWMEAEPGMIMVSKRSRCRWCLWCSHHSEAMWRFWSPSASNTGENLSRGSRHCIAA